VNPAICGGDNGGVNPALRSLDEDVSVEGLLAGRGDMGRVGAVA
jgi:hypothetical protein